MTSRTPTTSRFKAAKNLIEILFKEWNIPNQHKNAQNLHYTNRAVFFDVDGTLGRNNLLLMFMHTLSLKNILPPQKAKKLLRAQKLFKSRRWKFDTYEQAVIDSIEELAGLPKWLFEHLADVMLEEFGATYYVITYVLLNKLQELGYKLFAITGAPNFILPKYFAKIGLKVDKVYSTNFIFEGKVFSGRVDVNVVENKGEMVLRLAQEYDLDLKTSIGIGDTEGDISLLRSVGKPLGINPNQKLVNFCKNNKIPFIVERKNLMLLVFPTEGRVIF